MNILIVTSNNDQLENVLMGWSYALHAVGFNVVKWAGNSPVFRVFEEFKPDYVLVGASSIDKNLQRAVAEFKPEVWTLFIKQEEFKLHIEGSKEIGVLSEAEVQAGQYHVPFGWDAVNYSKSKREEKYVSPYAYVGRYKEELQGLLASFSEGGLRIYSPDPHNSLCYVGSDNNKPAIFASAGIVILPQFEEGFVNDTDMWNCLYSGTKCGTMTNPPLDGTHSYFHRIYDFLKQVGGYDELKTKLFDKMTSTGGER